MLIADAAAWLATQLATQAGTAAVYRRGAVSVAIIAVRGRTEYEAIRADGSIEKQVSVDHLVQASTLILGGQTILPARGDLIEVGDETFEVLAIPGAREHRTCDPVGVMLRIHTKQRKAEP